MVYGSLTVKLSIPSPSTIEATIQHIEHDRTTWQQSCRITCQPQHKKNIHYRGPTEQTTMAEELLRLGTLNVAPTSLVNDMGRALFSAFQGAIPRALTQLPRDQSGQAIYPNDYNSPVISVSVDEGRYVVHMGTQRFTCDKIIPSNPYVDPETDRIAQALLRTLVTETRTTLGEQRYRWDYTDKAATGRIAELVLFSAQRLDQNPPRDWDNISREDQLARVSTDDAKRILSDPHKNAAPPSGGAGGPFFLMAHAAGGPSERTTPPPPPSTLTPVLASRPDPHSKAVRAVSPPSLDPWA